MTNLVDNLVQCWGCPIFDRLFQIISVATAAIYEEMVVWAWVVLVAFWAAYIFWVVYKHLTDKESKDWLYQDSVKPVLINSLIISTLLGMGIWFPKFITTITFEPVASVVATYTETILETDAVSVNQKVTYQPDAIRDNGFFRPELRDKIIVLMKTTITQFQSMMKLGLAVIDKAEPLRAILGGIGNLLRHILMFMMGVYLVYQFFQLFIRFCFYFIDVMVALAMFAFFFPFMLVFFVFKNSPAAADWVKKMGDAFAPKLLKDVYNAIIALSVAVITYTIVMVILAKFFASDAMSSNEVVKHIMAGTVSSDMLANDNLVNLTLMGAVVLGFILNYLTGQIPTIAKDIFGAFGVKPEAPMGEQVGQGVETTAKNIVEGVVTKAKILVGSENKDDKKEDKKEEDKK